MHCCAIKCTKKHHRFKTKVKDVLIMESIIPRSPGGFALSWRQEIPLVQWHDATSSKRSSRKQRPAMWVMQKKSALNVGEATAKIFQWPPTEPLKKMLIDERPQMDTSVQVVKVFFRGRSWIHNRDSLCLIPLNQEKMARISVCMVKNSLQSPVSVGAYHLVCDHFNCWGYASQLRESVKYANTLLIPIGIQ